MQNQQTPPGERAARQQKQASRTEDTFRGGSADAAPAEMSERWLRSPWKPAAGRLWPERKPR